MFIYLIQIFIILIVVSNIVNSLILPKYTIFLDKKYIYNKIINLIMNDSKKPIILNGNKTIMKKEFCKIFCDIKNISFYEYTFDKFIIDLPYNKKRLSLIYVNDYLIGNGRVFNNYEENILENINQSQNLIIFESENIENIVYKNNNINKLYNIIEFPYIDKLYIEQYIYYSINYYNYTRNLYLLNWLSYDIENIDLENINILLFELNNMFTQKKPFSNIHKSVNKIISSLQ